VYRRVWSGYGDDALHRPQDLDPGPRSQEILARKARVIADPLSIYLPIVAADARGALLTDVDGNTFVDFTGGVGCLNVGHAHPHVTAAVQEQAARFLHTDFTMIPYEVYVTLAERLLERAPVPRAGEGGILPTPARRRSRTRSSSRGAYTRRPAVIAFEGGSTGGRCCRVVADVEDAPVQGGARSVRARVYRVPFPYEYRGITAADALGALRRAFDTQVAVETVAAIVLEAASRARAGSFLRAQEFVDGIRALCDEHGMRDGRRRGADRVRAHGPLLLHRALRRRARPDHGREVDRRGSPALGCARQAAAIMDAPGDSAVGGTFVGQSGSRRPPRSPSST